MSKMKLKLDVEALAVESFGTQSPERGRGTVQGNAVTRDETCIGETCWDTCICAPSYPDYCPGWSGLQHSCVPSCMQTCQICSEG